MGWVGWSDGPVGTAYDFERGGGGYTVKREKGNPLVQNFSNLKFIIKY